MPSATASFRRALTASAPAWWPAATSTPSRWAQRPFPSVMMATYRAGTSDFEDLGLLGLQRAVDLADRRVGELLQLALGPVLLVLADIPALAQLAEVLHGVAADVADRDAALLGDLPGDLDHVLAAFLGHLRDLQPDDVAVVVGREAEVGLLDGALDRLHGRLVVGLDGEQPRLGCAERGQLLERRLRPVVVDDDAVQQRGARAAGADALELRPRRLHGLRHVVLGVSEEVV